MADGGEDVSRYFTNPGKMMQPIQPARPDGAGTTQINALNPFGAGS
jgi:hypothetical protein